MFACERARDSGQNRDVHNSCRYIAADGVCVRVSACSRARTRAKELRGSDCVGARSTLGISRVRACVRAGRMSGRRKSKGYALCVCVCVRARECTCVRHTEFIAKLGHISTSGC